MIAAGPDLPRASAVRAEGGSPGRPMNPHSFEQSDQGRGFGSEYPRSGRAAGRVRSANSAAAGAASVAAPSLVARVHGETLLAEARGDSGREVARQAHLHPRRVSLFDHAEGDPASLRT